MKNNEVTYPIRKFISFFILFEVVFALLFFLIWNNYGGGQMGHSTLMFKNPLYLLSFLLLIPFYVFYFIKLNKLNLFVNESKNPLQNSFITVKNSKKTFINIFLLRNAFVFLVMALAHPIYGEKTEEGVKESMEVVITMDISNSMNARDIDGKTSRLEVAKRSVIQLMNSFNGQKIGVCVFAGGAYIQLPLTNDYPIAKMFVNEIETSMLSNQGTNIDQAFRTSFEMFSEEKTTKAIIMITDGENHESSPSRILSKIKENDIKVCVLGIGSKMGGLVPVQPNRPELGYKLGEDGNFLLSKVDTKFIKSIATKVNGYATLTSHPFPDLTQLVKEIKKMKRNKIGSFSLKIKADKYQFLLLVSLSCLILYFLNNLFFKKIFNMKYTALFFLIFLSNQFFAQSWKDSLIDARKLYQNKEYVKAYDKYNRILKIVPKNIDISEEVAQAAYKAEKFDLAEENYIKKVNQKGVKPKSSTYHNLGNAQMKQKNYQGAIDSYKKALKINPNDEETRYNLSEAIRKLKQQQNNNKEEDNKNQDKNQQNQRNRQNQKEEDEKKDDNSNQQSSISNNTVDKILDNLSKQEAKTKQKNQEKKKSKGSSSSGRDW